MIPRQRASDPGPLLIKNAVHVDFALLKYHRVNDASNMSNPRKILPKTPTFEQKGLKGYAYPMENGNMEAYVVDVATGHDTFIVSRKCVHVYSVLQGNGIFTIDGTTYPVNEGDLIEVLPGFEYTYSGTMRLLLLMNPPWFEGNEKIVRNNPSAG